MVGIMLIFFVLPKYSYGWYHAYILCVAEVFLWLVSCLYSLCSLSILMVGIMLIFFVYPKYSYGWSHAYILRVA